MYHENGKLEQIRNYKNGKREGEMEIHIVKKNGNYRWKAIGNYKNGKLEGEWKFYHNNGKLNRDWKL